MPALPPVPNVIKCQWFGTLQDDPNVVGKFYIHYTGTAPTSGQLNTLATTLLTSWNTNMAPAVHPNYNTVSAELVDLTSSTSASGSAAAVHAGTRSGATLSAGVCAVVNHLINRRYRGGKPRSMIWAGIETDLQTVGTWKTAFISTMETAWSGLVADVCAAPWSGGGTLAPVNVSYYQGFTAVQNPTTLRWRNVPKLRTGGPVVDFIFADTVRAALGSQRRRNQ